jgi:radical SAM-linked protein
VRFRFSKLGKIRWTSHRDLARMWERAFRRVGLPLAYSEGFSPRPRISFGLALPTGHESLAEYLDVELIELPELGIDVLPDEMSAALPVGVDVTCAALVEPGSPSLQESVTSCSWRFAAAHRDGSPPPERAEIASRIDEVMAAGAVIVTVDRKGSPVTEDIRPAIIALHLGAPVGTDLPAETGIPTGTGAPADAGGSPGVWLEAELASQPRSLRPATVVAALGSGFEERSVRRTHQWISREGARREPLAEGCPGDATDAPRAMGRAS